MNEDKYAKQEKSRRQYMLASAQISGIRKVHLEGFPKGELFARIHTDYKRFRDIQFN